MLFDRVGKYIGYIVKVYSYNGMDLVIYQTLEGDLDEVSLRYVQIRIF